METSELNEELRILMLEDTPSDAELTARELRRAGIKFVSERVEKRAAFLRALDKFRPDIVLSDFNLPDFDGLSALKYMRQNYPEVPVVMVTGALTDIEAFELINAGARDYVLKDRLARLPDAVKRALSMERGARARKAAEEKIHHLANFDPLTELPNRALLLDRLKQAMSISSRSGCHNALLYIDLDNFKALNDTKGHDKGDLLLQRVAERLAGIAREGDTVAHPGGDEFLVMLTGLSGVLQDAAKLTEHLGAQILATLNQPFLLGDFECHITASIGATLFRGHQTSTDDLLKQADLAMYKAKEAGRNALRFFDAGMEADVIARSALEADLRAAIEKRQFRLYYQPQIAGISSLSGAEALVRWDHPVRKLVPPAEFIGLAEETGLILPLGRWVLETACAQLAAWRGRPGLADLTLAVNVSAKQFRDPGFVEQVLAALHASSADPHKLKLELTESVLLDNVQEAIEKMHALKAKGVSFSLDDFGTGYSSLSYLKRLPLDQLKIDRSFVRDVLTDSNDAVIAKTIIALAATLGLTVIAEGVENAAQQSFLAASGCHAYQGYLFSKPLPPEEFEAFAARQAGA